MGYKMKIGKLKLQRITDLTEFIDKEIMPNQPKYILYLIGGLVALVGMIWFMGK